jgi:hypothetical protein
MYLSGGVGGSCLNTALAQFDVPEVMPFTAMLFAAFINSVAVH